MTTPTTYPDPGTELDRAQVLLAKIAAAVTNPDLPDGECLDKVYALLQSDGWITPT